MAERMNSTPKSLAVGLALIGAIWFASAFRDTGLDYKTAQNAEYWQTSLGINSSDGRFGFSMVQTKYEGDPMMFDDGIHGRRVLPNHGWFFYSHRMTAKRHRPMFACGVNEDGYWRSREAIGFGLDRPKDGFFSENSFRAYVPYYLPFFGLLIAGLIKKRRANQAPLPTPEKCPPSNHGQLPGAADL